MQRDEKYSSLASEKIDGDTCIPVIMMLMTVSGC